MFKGKLSTCRVNYFLLIRVDETDEMMEKRKAAIWDSDCAFEAENEGDADWLK